MISSLKNKVLQGGQIGFDEALQLSRESHQEQVWQAADDIREQYLGPHIELCSITNARSGHCPENCKWCSQSIHHRTSINTYDFIDPQTAVSEACSNAKKGIQRHSLVTSGKRVSEATLDQLITIYRAIHAQSNVKLCASLGLISRAQLERLKNEGHVSRYHCNLETAPSFFPKLCTSHHIEEKIATIQHAQDVGLSICSGGIIGMGETMEQRIELAFSLRDLGVDSIPLNLLMPAAGTPLEYQAPLSQKEILSTLALFRFIHPQAHIRLAGGRQQIAQYQKLALHCGLSSLLSGDYLTTSGSDIDTDREAIVQAGFRLNM